MNWLRGFLIGCAFLAPTAAFVATAHADESVAPAVANSALTVLPSNVPVTVVKYGSLWVQVQEFTVTWARPDTRVNGDALPYSELGGYRLYWIGSDGVADSAPMRTIAKRLRTAKLKQPVCTTYSYAMTAIDTDKKESALSPVVTVTTYCPS